MTIAELNDFIDDIGYWVQEENPPENPVTEGE